MLRLFMPLDDKLGKMHRQGATEQAQLHVDFALGQKLTTTFFNNSKSLVIQNSSNYKQFQAEPVFIPTKEVLSFMKG
ncbi:MAG: AAA family ATPase, partial [Gammaproteobacteria bacterium]|nr:AAA family ATPase [Gammaproteobacteria bacterium]